MEDQILRNIFDPGWFNAQPKDYQEQEDKEKTVLERAEFEKIAYDEITKGLEEDLKRLGIGTNYASKIIIGEIAMKMVLISRIKWDFVNKSITSFKRLIRADRVRNDKYSGNKSIGYDLIDIEEKVHPVYTELLPRIEKELNKQLGLLGLLPFQQIERQKVILVEKLKKRLINIKAQDTSYTAEATIETLKTN